jgi:membrane-bound ClpP family serine protease
MRIGASLFLIAVGAILTFAVTKQVNGVDLSTIGVILMIVGIIGLLITLAMVSMRRRTDIIHRRTGTTVIEPNDPIDPVDPRY